LHYRKKIPVLIHINGTRGKSSVTRLIAAGLREGGKQTIAKTTGSAPRIILENGSEIPIKRPCGPNIREQVKICKFAAKRSAEALVLECMAVMPEYQWVTEHKIVRSDIGVITNIRLDHLDVMGPGIKNVTYSICNTIPQNSISFTSEKKLFPYMKKIADQKQTKLLLSDPEAVDDEVLEQFSYIEHKDNISLALDVCKACGVERDIALEGMKKANPDIGATTLFHIHENDRDVYFAHSFAANDPESTEFVINSVKELHPDIKFCGFILNTRADRMFRSKQLVKMLENIDFDGLYLIGQETSTVYAYVQSNKLPMSKVHNFGWVTGEQFMKKLDTIKTKNILLIGIGNIGGNGGIIVNYFKEKSKIGEA
ncbi:MAG: poly-gamma-glutamate synthase PgsB, partial [Candidatus Cloacimonetes bacterium]|nr:poly-gamma-glutamate synthase PgsB [Candidatus Cloacimonadota bacterium]